MADPKDIVLKAISGATTGLPILITSTAIATPTVGHTHAGGTADADLVTFTACNTHTSAVKVTVLVYSGTPSSPANVLNIVTIPAGQGSWLLCQGKWLSGGLTIGFIADVASVVTVDGGAPKATLAA